MFLAKMFARVKKENQNKEKLPTRFELIFHGVRIKKINEEDNQNISLEE